jgi:hypothetical protein
MPKITELYAYVVADADENDEGVPGFSSNGWLLPMMGADYQRAESLREQAELIANAHGKSVKLIRSTGIEVVEIIKPRESNAVQRPRTEDREDAGVAHEEDEGGLREVAL